MELTFYWGKQIQYWSNARDDELFNEKHVLSLGVFWETYSWGGHLREELSKEGRTDLRAEGLIGLNQLKRQGWG